MKSTALLAFSIFFLATMARAVAQEVSGVEHWVEHGGIKIYLWEKYLGNAASKPIAVLAHGSATAVRRASTSVSRGSPRTA